jgi:hypothetical protein
MDSEEGTDAGLHVCVLERDRTACPPGDAFNGVCGARSKICFPPRHILRAATPRRAMVRRPCPLAGFLRRPAADIARPGCPSQPGPPFAHKTQYKCGNSRVWNNYPLGKPGYDQRLLLAPASRLRWSEMAAETGLSNGAQMLVHSTADGSTTPAIRAMERPLLEAFPTVGPKA